MKKKIFTLLTLLVMCVTGAWAFDALSYASISETTLIYTSAENLTATGYAQDGQGNQTYSTVSSRGTAMNPTNESNNDYDIGSNGVYLKSANTAKEVLLYVTNVTKIEVYCKCNSKADRYPIITATPSDATTPATVNGSALNSGATASGKTSLTLNAAKEYTISIHANDADITLYALRLTAAPKEVSSKVLTGIKINGSTWDIAGLTNNAATIATEYAGPPTVQFVYTENYTDNTSATGKTQNVVAVKSGANYVATSTVLTTNATLTFTNVSNVLFSISNPTAPTEDLASKASSVVTATFSPGGSAIVYNGHKSNTAQMVINGTININSSGDSYFQASFPAAMAEGDVIDCSNHSGTFYVWYSDSKSNSQTLPYTIPANSDLIGKKTLYLKKNGAYDFTWLTITRPKTIDTQELGGVKEGSTTLTVTTDYTVSSTTITLTEAHKSVLAPTNIKLINHITYDDASTEDQDVAVTLAKNGDYFEGTATIGATTYTVKVPVDATTPALSLSASSGSISLNSYTPTGSVKVTLTGTNLTDGTYDAPTAEGVTITPASYTVTDGAASQEFTITSTASTAASTDIVFEYDGAESQTYTLSYSKTAKRSLSQIDVTTATTWDWTKSGGASIELTASTDPANGAEFLLAALPEINNDANFNSQALKVACQWPNRGTDYYFQGNTVKFNITVPGTVQVWFSNTSNRQDNATNRRYLYVNGTNSGVYTLNQTFTNTEAMSVSAGEVIINAYTGQDTPVATMVRINKIVFTPTAEPATPTTEGDETYLTTTANMDGWRSFYDASQGYTVDGNTTVYVATDNDASSVTLTSIDGGIPAGTPVILHTSSSADNYKMTLTKASVDAYEGTNLLTWTTSAVDSKYRLGYGGEGVGFYPYSGTPASGAVILNVSASARALTFVFDNETSGIETVHASGLTVNGFYNLNGQRVENPTKGLYIVNGKKVVIK